MGLSLWKLRRLCCDLPNPFSWAALCFKRCLLLYIKKTEPNRTEPILTKTETNRLHLRTEPPIVPVSRNRNEPKRTGGFLTSADPLALLFFLS